MFKRYNKKGRYAGVAEKPRRDRKRVFEVSLMNGNFVISRSKDGEFYFKIYSSDGRALAQGECFDTLLACKSGLASACECLDAEVAPREQISFGIGKAMYEIVEEEDGFEFFLKGAFGEVLAFSDRFSDYEECYKAAKELSQLEIDIEDLD